MSTGQGDPGGFGGGPTAEGRPPTEEELRAAYEAEIAKVKVEQVLLEHVVTLINLGMRRTGLVPGTEAERDPVQVRIAIEAIRVQLPLLEQAAPRQISPIRDALSQLQLAYVKIGGAPGQAPGEPSPEGAPGAGPGGPGAGPGGPGEGPGGPSEQAPPKPGEPGPAQRSGRLWVPGQ
ncbi:MAG: hypothetical protein ACXVUE_19150 [Solirubrobacteraceae bacterium]